MSAQVFFFSLLWLLWVRSHGMLSKHARTWYDPRQSPAERLQANIDALASGNLVSASRVESLLSDAESAGVSQLRRCLPRKESKGPTSSSSKNNKNNCARGWKRRKLKHSQWPTHYYFQCRLWDPKTNTVKAEEICMDLVHELIETMVQLGREEVLLATPFLDQVGKEHLEDMKARLGTEKILALGIHGDGIPCNYDRTESVFALSLNLPGVGGRWQRMRIPMVVLPKGRVCEETMYDVFEVIAWSLRHLQQGSWPTTRHDGEPWKASDKQRRERQGPLASRAALVEVRGDWEFYSQVFGFPYHNEKDGICWRCPCKRDEVHSYLPRVVMLCTYPS